MTYRIGLQNGRPLIPKREWTIPDDYQNAIPLNEACTVYFYSREALIRQIKKGKISGFKIGHRWYIVPTLLKVNMYKRKTDNTL